MRIPNKAHTAAKAFFRDLIDACGGPKRCQALTAHPDSHLSAMGSPHVIDRWPRLDHIIDLEHDCGQPIVTRYLADLLGFDLVPREGRATADLPHVFAAAMKDMTEVQVAYVTAVANHNVSAAERAELVKQATHAIAGLQDFIVAVRGSRK